MEGGKQNSPKAALKTVIFAISLLLLSNPLKLSAQSASIKWDLSQDEKVSSIEGPLYGYDQTLSGMYILKYKDDVTGAAGFCQYLDIDGTGWPSETKQNDNRYIQFAVSPKAGITFNVDTVSFYYTGKGGHQMRSNLYVSTDSNFVNATQLNPVNQPLSNSENNGDMKLFTYNLSKNVEYGQILYFRIYPWYAFSATIYTKYVCLQNVIISGTTSGTIQPVLPIVTTIPVYDISNNSAVSGGKITFDGESDILSKGVCWNTSPNPTTSNFKTDEGPGKGEFSSKLTGLQKSTKYYVRAYAVNAAGTNYGEEDSLVTLESLSIPVVKTLENPKVVGRSVTILGEIIDWGGADITEKGICYNTSGSPTVNDNKQVEGSGSSDFTSFIYGLKAETKFYAKAFATNSLGTGYGEEREFEILKVLKGAYADGIHYDTNIIQAAIDSCSNIHGTLDLTNGVYLSGLLQLKSNITLYIDSTATLLASDNKYDFLPAGYDTSGGKLPSTFTNFITSSYADNITIAGYGKIDGNGQKWWDEFRNAPAGTPDRRPRLMQLAYGKHIRLENITLTNSPKFHFVPHHCFDVYMNNVKIIAPSDAPNTDAIDPSVTHNMVITNCYLDVGDDDVALKSGSIDPADPNAACSNIRVENCTIKNGHGISIGSETNGGVDSFYVNNCTFDGTDIGIRIKSNRTRGGDVRNCTYSNITINNVKTPILLDAYYSLTADENDPPQPITKLTPYFHDITLKNVTITNSPTAGRVIGLPETKFTNINFENVNISTGTGLTVRNATINFNNSNISVSSGEKFILQKDGIVNIISGIEDERIPNTINLSQNYPNPFNPSTMIHFSIPAVETLHATSLQQHVVLKVYDVLGREIATLVDEQKAPGNYFVTFDGSNLTSGIYFYSLEFKGQKITKKMLMLK